MTKLDDTWNEGFNAGLQWTANCLRLAADAVEKPVMATFERKGNGATFEAIAKTGQTHFANQLRSVADEIELAIEKAKSDGTPT